MYWEMTYPCTDPPKTKKKRTNYFLPRIARQTRTIRNNKGTPLLYIYMKRHVRVGLQRYKIHDWHNTKARGAPADKISTIQHNYFGCFLMQKGTEKTNGRRSDSWQVRDSSQGGVLGPPLRAYRHGLMSPPCPAVIDNMQARTQTGKLTCLHIKLVRPPRHIPMLTPAVMLQLWLFWNH